MHLTKLNSFLFLIFLFGIQLLKAQEIVVPYKIENKFGLSDGMGNQLVKPEYDAIEWLTDEYFVAIKIEENSLHNKNPKQLKSLFYKSLEIIGNQDISRFNIIPETVIISYSNSNNLSEIKPENSLNSREINDIYFSLYNSNGKQIGERKYKRLEIIGQTGKSNRNQNISKYILLFSQNFKNEFSLFIFDSDEGNIKEFLIKEVKDFKVLNKDFKTGFYFIQYQDSSNKIQQKEIVFTSNYVELKNSILPEKPKRIPPKENEDLEINQIVDYVASRVDRTVNSITFPYYLKNKKDLYYLSSANSKKKINHKTHYFFRNSKDSVQHGNVIYKKNSKYGLIINGKESEKKYDSMDYFNTYFLACNIKNSKKICGILDQNGENVIPIKYDSIVGDLNSSTNNSQIVNTHFKFDNQVFRVYKNGKIGVYNYQGNQVLPIEYSLIEINKFSFSEENKKTDFLVLQKDGLYGIIYFEWNTYLKERIQYTIEPIFQNYPGFIHQDYYGKSGVVLFGLMDENGNFATYASEFGFHFEE